MTWKLKPFERASLVNFTLESLRARARDLGIEMSEAELQAMYERLAKDEVYINDVYQVNIHAADIAPLPLSGERWPPMVHLSIKRRDKAPIHDWRDLQEIKNMLVGPEHEAVELYPAATRVVDTSNQYHLWVFRDPAHRFPFGFMPSAPIQVDLQGAAGTRQRPFRETPPQNCRALLVTVENGTEWYCDHCKLRWDSDTGPQPPAGCAARKAARIS